MSRSTRQCCVSANKNDGFLRVAAASPRIRVADVEGNAEVALAAVREAAERGSMKPVSCRLSLPSVFPLQLPRISTTASPCAARASFWASRPRSICPTMASSMSAVGLLRHLPIPFGLNLPVRVRSRWVRGLSTAAAMRTPRIWYSVLRFARTCGCQRLLRPRWRLPVPR